MKTIETIKDEGLLEDFTKGELLDIMLKAKDRTKVPNLSENYRRIYEDLEQAALFLFSLKEHNKLVKEKMETQKV